MKKIIFVILVNLLIGSSGVFAQKEFTKIETEDNVTFYYRWKPSCFLKKDSPLILSIKVTNENDFPVETTFTVDYYWNSVLSASSDEQSFDLKKGKSLIGKIKKMGFDRSEFTDEQLLSEQFTIEINGIKVKKKQ